MSETDFSEIQSIFNEFVKNHNEIENIQKEIRNFQKQYRNRLIQLKNTNKEYEKSLIDYLEKNQLPGIRSGEFLLLTDEKPLPSNKQIREEKVHNLLRNHQIDTDSRIYKEIVEMIRNPKNSDKMTKKIRCKKYNGGKPEEKSRA